MLISIIIPVYNSEKYLAECLDSILNNTFRDFELLLINDGSTDSSAVICDEYAETDGRVSVFHQQNKGVSTARNLGLKHAKGKWLTFVDSDDVINNAYFDVFNQKHMVGVDLILLNIYRLDADKAAPLVQLRDFNEPRDRFMGEFSLYPHFPGPCGKFFKREIISVNNIFYDQNLEFGEDALFNLMYLQYTERISSYKKGKYFYRDTPNSLSKKQSYINDGYLLSKIEQILKNCYPTEIYGRYVHYPLYRYFFSIMNSEITKSQKKELLKNLLNDKKELVMSVLTGQSIHGIPLTSFLRSGFLKPMICLFNFSNKIKQ